MTIDTIFITDTEANTRLDIILTRRYPDQSRSYFHYLIKEGLVLLNGKAVKKQLRPKCGDEVKVEFALTPEISVVAEDIPLDIIYEDEHFLAVNKAVGMVVHPAHGNWSGTFVNALLYHCKELPDVGDSLRPGIVHRLDKDTSGVLIAAKTLECHRALVEMFSSRNVSKKYLSICVGNPGSGEIITNIARDHLDRKKMSVVEDRGKEAITRYTSLAHNEALSIVEVALMTGRTHQIRVHMQHLKSPVLGDSIYGSVSTNKKYGVKRQLLHAWKLSFDHPITHEHLDIVAPIPSDMASVLKKIAPSWSE
ncbi:MAG: RluA family pseudouridine synthase [Waddliaceae bacterium]|nr:RluA family pseudouridine synthase [Waddliaceae bacterium]